jgi:succinate dehydrogenase membrane anchor subunit
MLAFLIVALSLFAIHPVHDYAQWLARLGRPETEVAVAMFFAALLAHMGVGLRDVLLDYAKPLALQQLLLAAVAAGLVAMAIAVIRMLISLHR